MPNASFLEQFIEAIKEEGTESISAFVNKWIETGGTFRSLHEWCLLRGIDRDYVTLYLALRDYLTIPYGVKDQFWYKWNAIARGLGYKSGAQMFRRLDDTKTTKEVAVILGVTEDTALDLMRKASSYKRGVLRRNKRRKGMKRKLESGFSDTITKERWEKKLQSIGFKTFQGAIKTLRRNGNTWMEIANILNVSIPTLQNMIKRANLNMKDFTKGRKPIIPFRQ